MRLIEWWLELPKAAQYGVAVLILGISAAMLILAGRLWIWGWIVGGVFLLMAIFGKGGDSTDF